MIFYAFLVIIVIILLSIYWYQSKSKFAKLLNTFPVLQPCYPVLGNNVDRNPDKLFEEVKQNCSLFKESFGVWAGPYGAVVIITADDAEIILSNPKYVDKGILYNFLQTWLGTGLLTSTESSMGIKLNNKSQTQTNYLNAVSILAETVVLRMFSPWLHPHFLYCLSPSYWREKKLLKQLHKFTNSIIEEKQRTFQESDVTDFEAADFKSKKRLAMLDLLIQLNRHFGIIDHDGIREEVDTFVFEGHDTTAVAINCALLLLSHHPEVQQKIFEELEEIFGDSNRHATYDDLQNMKYLERCIKESLRLYPSVAQIARNLKEDTQLTNHVAPAGADVWIQIYTIHRDPKHFPDPEKFDPDRFLPENCIGRNPYAYIPFSAGPRNCIGQKFAMLEIKSIVSSVIRNFVMEPIDKPEDLKWLVDFVLRVKGPIHIKFKPRVK